MVPFMSECLEVGCTRQIVENTLKKLLHGQLDARTVSNFQCRSKEHSNARIGMAVTALDGSLPTTTTSIATVSTVG